MWVKNRRPRGLTAAHPAYLMRGSRPGATAARFSAISAHLVDVGPPVSAGRVAQLVEQRTENPCVGGSIPPSATKFKVL